MPRPYGRLQPTTSDDSPESGPVRQHFVVDEAGVAEANGERQECRSLDPVKLGQGRAVGNRDVIGSGQGLLCERLAEEPYDVERTLRTFEESNRMFPRS